MRRPRSLRTRLVVSAVALIAVVCAVIGTVTAVALRSYLYERLDVQLAEIADRAAKPPPPGALSKDALPNGALSFLGRTGQDIGTLGATLTDGRVDRAAVSDEETPARFEARLTDLTEEQKAALQGVARDGAPHTVSLPGLGDYRVMYMKGEWTELLVGVPTEGVEGTVRTLIVVELCVTAAGLVAAGIAGAVLVGVALRPLRRVAATATRVSELPLHSGEPALHERVPDADPRTEVGQVGAALNRMLGHVHSALSARQESETRVRRFVADASHELRTPLASIRGYAELTRRGHEETGPDTRRALGRIESEATRMTGLVEDLLLLARLDNDLLAQVTPQAHADGTSPAHADAPSLSYETTDLSPLVVDAVSDARAAGSEHVWLLELPAGPALVRADPARLHQVLVNLLANARTHTPPGSRVTTRVRDGERLRIEVEDDGPGIPAELLPHVFERFARGDASRARANGGAASGSAVSGSAVNGSAVNGSAVNKSAAVAGSTGLGLAIVRAVVTAHGGSVRVDSAPGRTLFIVDLPKADPDAVPKADPVADPKADAETDADPKADADADATTTTHTTTPAEHLTART
ncbi:sensor histidine kinase [Streptomyces sp. KLOTTS4A1]|uniref:sensor histidine kinase n=1 Tax=Streptomyces sp. KLOTTS4A1 TaxID=3390996 RepID=UPI0039F547FB